MNELLNPYIAGAPVTETSMFFGREDVFSWIERSLAGKYVDHILVLHGQRRVGKTSVLKQIPNFLQDHYLQVFFDLQGRTNTTLDRFLWWMAREIARTLKQERNITISKPDREDFKADPEYLINGFLPSLSPMLGDQILLLTFDEFDTLDRPEIQEGFAIPLIAYLRRLIDLDNLNFIFSIGSSGDKLENMQASYTDFFKTALYRKISFLTADDCHRLITKPVEGVIKYDREAVNRIVEITSGHPYFTQLMCHELFSQCQKTGSRSITSEDVTSILDDVVERGTVNLKFVWDEASDLEKWILAGLAHGNGAASVDKLMQLLQEQRVRFSENDLNSAIIHLRDKDVITRENQFVIHLMRMWLETNRPLDRVREELLEVNPIANRYIEIGDEYRDMGETAQAIESYQQALNADPGNLKAQSSIGAVHLGLKAYQEAIAAFEIALKIDDEDVISLTGYCDAYQALGDQARSAGDISKAIRYFKKILVINPAHTDARQRLAEIYRTRAEEAISVGKDEEALSAFSRAQEFTPEDDRLSARYEEVLALKKARVIAEWLEKSDKALARQRWDEAAEAVEEALRLEPENVDLQNRLMETKDAPRQFKIQGYRNEAELAIQRGKFEKAIAALETALLLAPEDQSLGDLLDTTRSNQLNAQLDVYQARAHTAIRTGDWQAAIAAYEEAAKLAPDDPTWEESIETTRAAQQQAKLDALLKDAETAQASKNWDAAIAALEGYLTQKPGDSGIEADIETIRQEKRQSQLTTFRSQAETATETENWGEAVTAWDGYLSLDPDDRAEVEKLLEQARRYASISSDYAEAQEAMRRRRYGRAIVLLQGIIAQDPTFRSTSRLLVEAVEANKATPIWRRPWVYAGLAAVAVLVLGVIFGPRLLSAISGDRAVQPNPAEIVAVGEVAEETLEPTSSPTTVVSATTEPTAESLSAGLITTTTARLTPEAEDTPTSVPQAAEPFEVLNYIANTVPTFADDFSTQKPEWNPLSRGVRIESGTLQMRVENNEDITEWADHLRASDFLIQYDFLAEGERTQPQFGIRDSKLIFEILGSSGDWLLSEENGTVQGSTHGHVEDYKPGEWNQLIIFAYGDQFEFYLNGELLNSVTAEVTGKWNTLGADCDEGAQGIVFIDNLNFWNLESVNLIGDESVGVSLSSVVKSYISENPATVEDDFSVVNEDWDYFNNLTGNPNARIANNIENGTLTIKPSEGNLPTEKLTFPTNGLLNGEDFVLKYKFKKLGDDESPAIFGVWFRSDENQSEYYEFTTAGRRNEASLSRYASNGERETIGVGNVYIVSDTFYGITIIVIGDKVEIYLDNKLVISETIEGLPGTVNQFWIGPSDDVSIDEVQFWNLDGVEY